MSDFIRLVVTTVAFAASLAVALCFYRRLDPGGGSHLPAAGHPRAVNELLLVVSLAGVVAAGVFGVVAGRISGRLVAVAGCLVSIIHAAVQVITMMTWSRRVDSVHRLSRTGRQAVAFLTVCNVALWLVDVAQEGGLRQLASDREGLSDVTVAVYGELQRRALGLICVPLAAFHRIQSVICLAAIWKRG